MTSGSSSRGPNITACAAPAIRGTSSTTGRHRPDCATVTTAWRFGSLPRRPPERTAGERAAEHRLAGRVRNGEFLVLVGQLLAHRTQPAVRHRDLVEIAVPS